MNYLSYPSIISMLLALPVVLYVSIVDIRELRIPNKVMFPAILVALLVACARPERWDLLLGGLAGCGILLFPSLLFGRTFGGGDIKLGLFLGLVLGWPGIFWTLFVGFVASFIFVVGGVVLGRLKFRSKIAFGPFLSLGGVVVGVLAVSWQLGL